MKKIIVFLGVVACTFSVSAFAASTLTLYPNFNTGVTAIAYHFDQDPYFGCQHFDGSFNLTSDYGALVRDSDGGSSNEQWSGPVSTVLDLGQNGCTVYWFHTQAYSYGNVHVWANEVCGEFGCHEDKQDSTNY